MIHELYRSEFPPGDATSALKRAAINRADHVICISESTRNDMLKLFDVPTDKVSVVHLGFERFDAKTLEIGRKVPSRPFLLFVGQRDGYKNFSGLLEAIASSRALRRDFDVVAFGGGQFTTAERTRISDLGLGERQVRQIGGHDTVLAQLYEDAAAFVYPSRYEGFGLPPLEAMAHRCPVVSSNTSSMPEVIGPAAEYFQPESSVDMAAAIDRVVNSPSRRAELEFAGLQRLELYDWRNCADQTLGIYRRVAGGLS
jgi:glycosyltransferase involved in cell wall biosynthesis